MQGAEVFIPIVLFLSIFGIFYVFLTSRHRERMAMIEKGVNIDSLPSKKMTRHHVGLKFGMLFIGVSLGFFFGTILDTARAFEHTEACYFSMIPLFGGLALVANFFLERKLNRKDDMEELV